MPFMEIGYALTNGVQALGTLVTFMASLHIFLLRITHFVLQHMCWMLVHWVDSCKTHELPSTKQTRQSDRLVRCLSCVRRIRHKWQWVEHTTESIKLHVIESKLVEEKQSEERTIYERLETSPNDRMIGGSFIMSAVRCAHRAPSNMNIGESLCAFTFVSKHFTHSKWLNFEMGILHLIAWALKMFH